MSTIKKKVNLGESEYEYESILIAEIARRPFIYDKTHKYYGHSQSQFRTEAWNEIADNLKKTEQEVKKKWEALRDRYRRISKKMSNEEISSTNWVHYESLKFLDDHIRFNDPFSLVKADIQKEFDTKLIGEVIKNKNLYDPMNESFRNMKERVNTWERISKAMNASVEYCKKRWNYLRDAFRKFYKNEKEEKKPNNWPHYESLKFLLQYDSKSLNKNVIKPPHVYVPPKREIPTEYINLLPITHAQKSDNESDCSDRPNDLQTTEKSVDLDSKENILKQIKTEFGIDGVLRKCGEILISETEIFSYKCCLCENKMENIENFTKHILDNHMGRNGNESIFKIDSIDNTVEEDNTEIENFHDFISNHDSNEDDSNQNLKKVIPEVVKKAPLKYIKNEVRKESPTEEDLKENPDDDPETSTLKRIKRQNKLIKIEKIGKYSCSVCSFSFDKEENLKKHESTHKKKAPYIVKLKKERGFLSCEQCNRRFQYRHQLERHKRLHTGERPYHCTLCEQKFRHYENLKEHYIFRHTEDRPFPCRSEGCDKKFKTKKTRLTHEALHSNELPYQCDECGKCFVRSSYLKRHRNTWHMDKNDRPYKCPHCTKSFCTQQNLKYHIYTHTGERPFGCPVCPSRFTKPWTVKEHMKIHSGERNYVCQICGKDFIQISGLIKHKKRHEKVEEKKQQDVEDNSLFNF